MAKRLTDKQKEEIIKGFCDGKKINDLSANFQCTNLTIIRNLKKNFGENKYKEILEKNQSLKESNTHKKNYQKKVKIDFSHKEAYTANPNLQNSIEELNEEQNSTNQFFEIAPLDYEIDSSKQKDLSSVPISEVDLPKIVYLIVDKNTELKIKYLKEYPEWQFLSKEDLERKTIEIFFDLKEAKRSCSKEHKVIKVPNTSVFEICVTFLLDKGISRIVSFDKLISL